MDYEKEYKKLKADISKAYLYAQTDSTKAVLETIFPELKESENERIRKGIKSILEHYKESGEVVCPYPFVSIDDALAWLEKQGEYKSSEEVLKIRQELYQSGYNDGYKHGCEDSKKQDEKLQGKTALKAINEEKVEPKFHKGDWILYKNDICKIVKREEGCNILVTQFGIEKEPVNERNLSTAKLWDISCAKDGDVLVAGDVIFIFNKIHGVWINCHCSLHKDNSFIDWDYDIMHIKYSKEIYPATKEQRNTLFKAMADAGYTFDFGKKELKKIEQPELTEFEDAVKDMMDAYRDAIGDCDATTEEVKKHAAYMLSLIPPKPTVGWRPSEEQMDALELAVSTLQSNTLETLYQDLKREKNYE